MKEGEKGKAWGSTGGSSEEAAPWAVAQHSLTAFLLPARETPQVRHRDIEALPFWQGRFFNRKRQLSPFPAFSWPGPTQLCQVHQQLIATSPTTSPRMLYLEQPHELTSIFPKNALC